MNSCRMSNPKWVVRAVRASELLRRTLPRWGPGVRCGGTLNSRLLRGLQRPVQEGGAAAMERMTWAGLRTAGVAQGSGQAKCRLLPPAFNVPLSLTLPRVLLPAPGSGGSPRQHRKALVLPLQHRHRRHAGCPSRVRSCLAGGAGKRAQEWGEVRPQSQCCLTAQRAGRLRAGRRCTHAVESTLGTWLVTAGQQGCIPTLGGLRCRQPPTVPVICS